MHRSGGAALVVGLAASVLACSQQDVRAVDSAHVDPAPRGAVPPASASGTAEPAPADAPAASLPEGLTCVVTDSSIGPIRLGMTFAQAREAIPGATFERTSDGDGAVLVGVSIDSLQLVTLYSEDDEEGPIDWMRRINGMETFTPLCSTTDGVHPKSLALDVEKILGKTVEITLSEIESRQYIEFERQPKGMTFRLDYTGIFPEGQRQTQRFEPHAEIFSIALWRR